MRNYILSAFLLFFLLIQPVFAQGSDEKILYFSTDITVNTDSSIDVTENISVNANQDKIVHGIVRKLPTSYADSYNVWHHTAYKINKILLNNQASDYHTQYANNQFEIFIGSRNVNLTPGIYTYTIEYHVNDAINFLKDADELYWNITGNDWTFPISKVDATIHLPAGADINHYFGYTGYKGEKGKDYIAREEAKNEISFSTTTQLQTGQGLTVAVAWPKGIVQQPTMLQEFTEQQGQTPYWLSLILLIQLLYFLTMWTKHGHALHKRTVIPLFTPPDNISPAAASYLKHMGFWNSAYTAAIVSLATKGFLAIENNNGTYNLVKKGNDTSRLSEEEKALAVALFAYTPMVTVSQANYSIFNQAQGALKKSLKSQFLNKLFVTNTNWFLFGILLTAVSYGLAIYLAINPLAAVFSLVWITIWSLGCAALLVTVYAAISQVFRIPSIGTIFKAIFMILFSLPFLFGEVIGLIMVEQALSILILPFLFFSVILDFVFYFLLKAYTPAGLAVIDQIEGFKLFIGTTERYRINQMNPPNQTPETFESFMPYAIALGVEYEWGQNFNNLLSSAGQQSQTYQPVWYTGSTPWAGASAAAFTTALVAGLGSSLSSVSASSSASGGGGSSGGGGGGGGGGGW